MSTKLANYTTIVHDTLRLSGLEVHEFFIADVIDKLSNPTCFMKRDVMATVCTVSKSTLKRALSKLEELGYIERADKDLRSTLKWRELVNTSSSQVNLTPCQVKMTRQPGQNDPVDQVKMNPLYISYVDTNIYNSEKAEKEPLPEQLPTLFGKTPTSRLATVYALMWLETFNTKYTIDYAVFTKALSPLLKLGLNEWQIAALIVTHFSWHGTTGQDEYAQKNLENNGYPVFWIKTKLNEYSTYISNVLEIDWNSPEALKTFVKDNIKGGYEKAVLGGILSLPDPSRATTQPSADLKNEIKKSV